MSDSKKNTFQTFYDVNVLPGEKLKDKLQGICLEQSVELPANVISEEIRNSIVGEVLDIQEKAQCRYQVSISYPVANAANEISQLLNILLGNISLKPGIRITGLEWEKFDHLFQGPAFGIGKLRKKWDISQRGISATALKPMGFSPQQLGELCYEFALGGIDIIKDDHGLTNQSYAPFEDRVITCVEAVNKAANVTGRRSLYFPNITTGPDKLLERYQKAAELGADGVLLAPHLSGLEMMHVLAKSDIDLPIMAHPAFSGSFVINSLNGIAQHFLYGEFWRALGADFVIYPNTGGRFSFSKEECLSINDSARKELAHFKKTFPTPGGGMQRNDLQKWLTLYGPDTVFLMGGSLYQHPEGVREAGKEVRTVLENASK